MKKIDKSLLAPFVQRTFPRLLPFVPAWMSANMISFLGLGASCLFALSLSFASVTPWAYYGGVFFILCNWATDTLDGMVARSRGQASQLGYYLDHFFDSLSVILLGTSIFAAGGSHVVIGWIICIIYLLIMVHTHIKTQIISAMEIPPIGPSEVRLLIATTLIAQTIFDYNQPLSWFPGITGDNGWLTLRLGFTSGLTFLDTCGVIAIAIASVAIWPEFIKTMLELAKLDRENQSKS